MNPYASLQASPPDAMNTSEVHKHGLFLWAVGGVLLLLGQAIFRLAPIAWDALLHFELSPFHIFITAVWVAISAVFEGYRGFQLKFVPRVLARAHHLAQNPTLVSATLAPLYAMAFFGARRRAKIAAWAVCALVVAAVVVVRQFPQPWRGIVDAGVVIGLGWGCVALVVGTAKRLGGQAPTGDPELASDER